MAADKSAAVQGKIVPKWLPGHHPGGRPRKYNVAQLELLTSALEQYIEENDDPRIVGFTSTNKVAIKLKLTKDDVYQYAEFHELTKRAIEKQEHYLLGQTDRPTMAIFRLKQPQHGYKDRTDIQVEATVDTTVTHTIDPASAALINEWTERLKQQTIAENTD